MREEEKLQGSEPRSPSHPPVIGIPNQNKRGTFDLDEHKAKTTQVFADFEEYQKILSDLKRRVEALEDILKRAKTG